MFVYTRLRAMSRFIFTAARNASDFNDFRPPKKNTRMSTKHPQTFLHRIFSFKPALLAWNCLGRQSRSAQWLAFMLGYVAKNFQFLAGDPTGACSIPALRTFFLSYRRFDSCWENSEFLFPSMPVSLLNHSKKYCV